MELNKEYEKDPLIEGIREGTFYVVICEALAESFYNFTYCPIKDECEQVKEEKPFVNFCADCPEDSWLKGNLEAGI